MVSPNIQWVLENLSKHTERDALADDGGPLIGINQLTGQAGAFYEKLRYLVDYKEEHTIRRSAIARILKRQLLVEGEERIGLSLLQELVGGGYLANKSVPESLAEEVQAIVNKYLLLGADIGNFKLANIMASEIERMLYPQTVNDLVAEAFCTTVLRHMKFADPIPEEEARIQTYIACRRALLEDDRDTLLYAVLITYLPELPKLSDENEIEQTREQFSRAMREAAAELENPLGWKIASRLKNHAIYFSVIREIIKKYGAMSETVLTDNARLDEEIKKFLGERYHHQHKVAQRSGTRAVIYILLTKIILGVAVELPYEKFVLNSIDYVALGTNILFHPLLLLGMVKTIRSPGSRNTNLIISGVRGIVHNENQKPVYITSSHSSLLSLLVFGFLHNVVRSKLRTRFARTRCAAL